jgi:hypothetical protein
MVNEIAGAKDGEVDGNKKSETEPWTIPLGKHFTYNPGPFMDQADMMRKTFAITFLIILGVVIVIYAPSVQILGILIIGSSLVCYGLSFYEMRLLDKRTRHELR